MLLVAIGNNNVKNLPAYHVLMESIFVKQKIISLRLLPIITD